MTFEYDLFVIHAEADEPFIRGHLLPAVGLAPERVMLSSALALGAIKLVELERGVQSSRCTVVVLSPAFTTDRLAELAELLASHASGTTGRLVPLCLTDCEVPLRLKVRVALDFRDPACWVEEGRKLRVHLQQLAAAADVPNPNPGMRTARVRPLGLIDFTAERKRHDRFVGRTALLAQLDQLLLEDRADRWVVVTGGPGMGKSALLAAWLTRRETAGAVVPHHFIRRGEYDWNDPAKLVGSLVAQIEQRFPQQREPEITASIHPAARLDAKLRRVSENELIPRGERLVVLVDGLDEYDPAVDIPGRDPLAAFLPRALPRGVCLLCASRPRHPYVDMLATRGAVQIDLDDERAFAADNEATVRAFWEQAAPELGLNARFITEAVAGAGGNLQHAAMLRQHLAGLPPGQRRAEAIPHGLAALLASAWERIATDPVIVDGLGILCAAREALTLDELGAVAGWTSEAQRRTFVRGARELLIESRREGALREYRLHHDSIRGQIAETIGTAALREHHRVLAQRLATWPVPLDATARRYALRHALIHRTEAGNWADAWRLVADMSFVEAKCRELGAQEAEVDVARAAERCGTSGDESLRGFFDDVARALRRELHWLRVAPEATAALVWNRLRRWGWSADEIDRRLQIPAGVSFLRERHVATRSPAFVRDFALSSFAYGCAVTPDGQHLVAALRHALQVWNLESGRVVALLKVPLLQGCAVTPDSQRVVSALGDGTLEVWDLATGHAVATLKGHARSVNACAVTPDGQRVVSASDDRTLKVWDLESGRAVVTLEGHAARVTACTVSPDGQRMVSASDDRTLKVWNLESGRAMATLEGHARSVLGCAMTPDGQRVVSASADHTLKIWDLATGRVMATLEGHANAVSACAVTPDGQRAISASWDKTLKVWDLATGRAAATLESDRWGMAACTVTPDGQRVISVSPFKLRMWDLETGRAVATLESHADAVHSYAVTPDGQRVVSVSADLTLKVWDLATGHVVAMLNGHKGSVNACAVTPDGQRVVSASWDNTLKVWDLATGHVVATLKGHASGVNACAVTPDSRRVVSASWDKTLKVWNLATRQVATLEGHASGVNACTVTPDGQRVVSASADHTLKVWDLTTWRAVATLEGHADAVHTCAVTPDGRHAISASDDRTLKVWDLATGRAVATLEGHACAVTPDGRRVVSASTDHSLKVWDLATGCAVATLEGHAGAVHTCAVTPDGQRVVSVSADHTLKVWDLETGTCLLTHRADAPYSAVIATATVIITGNSDGSVQFLDWPSSSTPPFQRLRQRQHRRPRSQRKAR